MAASGVGISDVVVTEFNNLKLRHKSYQYIQFKLNDKLTEVVLDKCVEKTDGDQYQEFVSQLPEGDCRYAIYDYHFTLGDSGERDQLIFVVWCPDTAKIKTKMLYASSKDALKKKLVGINHEIQATEPGELNRKDVTEKITSKAYK